MSTDRVISAIERALDAPHDAQDRVRQRILDDNRDTEYGRCHRFEAAGDYDGFRRLVPIVEYEAIEPLIARMIEGEANVLIAAPVVYFGVSSGTSGGKKYIPIHEQFADETEQWMALERHFLARAHPGFEQLPELRYINRIEGQVPCGTACGAVSAWYYGFVHAQGRYDEIVPFAAFQIAEVAARNYTVLRFALAHPVGRLTAVNPSTLLLLARTLRASAEPLIRDVRDGDVSHPELTEPTRTALRALVRPDPERARQLESAAERAGLGVPDAWPSMRLLSCWMHAGASLYAADLRHEFGQLPVWDYGYTSTEGRVTVTADDAGAGLPVLTSAFFELRDSDGTTRPLVDARPGEQGEMIVTNSRGLYRYATGDVVEVSGMYRQVPLIKYQRKLRATASLTGEKLTELEVRSVVQQVLDAERVTAEFFCLCAEWGTPPRYCLALEARGAPLADDAARRIAQSVERGLAAANPEYERKRATLRLGAVSVLVLDPGARRAYIDEERGKGREEARIKLPVVTMDLAMLGRLAGRRVEP